MLTYIFTNENTNININDGNGNDLPCCARTDR